MNSLNNNEQISFLQGLLIDLEGTPESRRNVLENKSLTSENKKIDQFMVTMVTDETLKQETILNPKDFIKKLKAGELKNITGKIIVTKNLYLDGDLITELPDNLEIQGNLSIHSCRNFKSLPVNLKAQSLSIAYCEAIINISNKIEVKESISITTCKNLESFLLSNTILKLEKDLFISECPKLQQIPSIKKIEKNVEIYDCLELTSLATIETVTGTIKILNCPKIKEIPAHWINLPANPKNNQGKNKICLYPIKVELTNTGIPLEQIYYYNNNSTDPVEFLLGLDQDRDAMTFKSTQEAVFYLQQFANEDGKKKISIDIKKEQQVKLSSVLFILSKATARTGRLQAIEDNANKLLQFLKSLAAADESSKNNFFTELNFQLPSYIKDFDSVKTIFNRVISMLEK